MPHIATDRATGLLFSARSRWMLRYSTLGPVCLYILYESPAATVLFILPEHWILEKYHEHDFRWTVTIPSKTLDIACLTTAETWSTNDCHPSIHHTSPPSAVTTISPSWLTSTPSPSSHNCLQFRQLISFQVGFSTRYKKLHRISKNKKLINIDFNPSACQRINK